MSHPFLRPRLAEILLSRGYASIEQVDAAAADDETCLGNNLLRNGVVMPEQLASALAERFNLPYTSLEGYIVPSDLFRLIPASDCYQYGVLPYRRLGEVLEVAVADPCDLLLQERLEAQHGLRVKLLLASRGSIEAALKRSEGETTLLKDMSDDFRVLVVREGEDGTEQLVSLDTLDETAGPVVKLVNTLLAAALTKRASDVHIETHDVLSALSASSFAVTGSDFFTVFPASRIAHPSLTHQNPAVFSH